MQIPATVVSCSINKSSVKFLLSQLAGVKNVYVSNLKIRQITAIVVSCSINKSSKKGLYEETWRFIRLLPNGIRNTMDVIIQFLYSLHTLPIGLTIELWGLV